ncbi:MAG: tetratricopeptide repeat protein [Candidatus Lernaella stagnicola]|nr:tetratricopeptide repeat protein [Candidatus Lernaella stagnicola]
MKRFLPLMIALLLLTSACAATQVKPQTTPDAEQPNLSTKMRLLYHMSQGYLALEDGNAPLAFRHFEQLESMGVVVPEVSLIKATMLIQSGSLERAMTEIDHALEEAPEDTNLLLLKAGMLAATSENEKAIEVYEKVLDLEPDNEMAAVFLSALYEEMNRLNKAKRTLVKFTKKNLNAAHAFFSLGRMELDDDNFAAAKAAFVRTTELAPENAKAWVGVGFSCEGLGEREQAIHAYKQAVELDPSNRLLRRQLISLHLREHDPDAAMAETRRLELLGGASETRVTMAVVLYHQGQTAEALAELNLVLSQSPDNYQACYLAGICMARLNRIDEAIAQYRKIPTESAYFLDSRLNLATLLMRTGRAGDALAELDLLEKDYADDLDLLRIRATVLSHMERFKQAEAALNKALKIKPRDSELLYSLAVLYERSGRWRDAVALMEKRLEDNPSDVDAMNFVGYTLADHNARLDRAEELLKRAVELRPYSGHIVDSYGWVLFKLERYDDAITFLKKALELEPSEAVIAEHIGDAYFAKGDKAKAREYWEKALTLNPDLPTSKRLKDKLGG